MRRALAPAVAAALPVSFALASVLVQGACGGGPAGATQPIGDGGADGAQLEDAGDEPFVDDIANPQGGSACTIGVGTPADPVALCFQGDILTTEIKAAYVPGQGIAQTWDDSGMTAGHAWQDDLGLASAISSFVCSAEFYGNATYGSLALTLGDLALVFAKELPTAPAGYDGEIYFRLRNTEAGYNYLNDNAHGAVMRDLADAYGRALQSTYAQVVPSGDAGSPGLVLGTPDPRGGVDYAPAEVIMGAAALLDMALVHGGDPDAGSDTATWQTTALAAVDYVWKRGRDPVTGLFYQALVTSGDPGHDTLLAGGTPTSDALLTDVQATAVLGLARVEDAVDALAAAADAGALDGAAAEESYLAAADSIVQSMTVGVAGAADTGMAGTKLWDGASSNATTPGAFVEGVVPSQGNALMTNKTTLSTAFLLGGINRLAVERGTSASYVLGQLRAALLQEQPAHSSLYTVVTSTTGFPVQDGFLRASSRDWNYATVFRPGEGGAEDAEAAEAEEESGAREYRADAINAFAEGINQLWRGGQNPPSCAP